LKTQDGGVGWGSGIRELETKLLGFRKILLVWGGFIAENIGEESNKKQKKTKKEGRSN